MPQAGNSRAQGSMEYLLLIGGVVLVAVIAILLLLQTSQSAGGEVKEQTEGGVAKIREEAGIALGGPGTVAKLDAGKIGAPTGSADLSELATAMLNPVSGEGGGVVPPDGGESTTFTFNQGGGNIQKDLPEVNVQ